MKKGELLVAEAALCALYLRGSPFRSLNDRRAWPLVVDALLRDRPTYGDVCSVLKKSGRFAEASALCSVALEWGLDVLERGHAFTILSPLYPRNWVGALGSGAPPCAWKRGDLPSAPPVAVVGTRRLSQSDSRFVHECGAWLMRSGCALVSGGAVGVDSEAVGGATLSGDPSRCVVIVPFGLEHCSSGAEWCTVSVCEPSARFTTGQAMERNALIYSYGRKAVVVRPRYREGGTWHGAVDAIRRRLGAVWVLDAPQDRASRALVALGALGLQGAEDLANVLSPYEGYGQPDLFGSSRVRESSDRRWRAGA